MTRIILAYCVFCCTAALAAEEKASVEASETKITDSPAPGLSGIVSLGSDYIFRGVSLTDHNPSLQGEVDWTHSSGIYLGAWGTNVRLPDNQAKAEADLSAGYNYAINSQLSAGIGAVFYTYFQASEANTIEIPGTLTWRAFQLGAAYAPHWGGGNLAHAWYLSAGWSSELVWKTTLSLGAGYSTFAPELGLKDYANFHLGFSRNVLGVNCDLSGYMVNLRQFNGADDPRAVFTLSKSI